MTTYALFVYDTRDSIAGLPEDEKHAVHDEFVAISELPNIAGHRLQPDTAVTLRVSEGEIETRPGAHDDPSRHLAGFYLLETGNADEALAIAARIPSARLGGAVQVQPLFQEA